MNEPILSLGRDKILHTTLEQRITRRKALLSELRSGYEHTSLASFYLQEQHEDSVSSLPPDSPHITNLSSKFKSINIEHKDTSTSTKPCTSPEPPCLEKQLDPCEAKPEKHSSPHNHKHDASESPQTHASSQNVPHTTLKTVDTARKQFTQGPVSPENSTEEKMEVHTDDPVSHPPAQTPDVPPKSFSKSQLNDSAVMQDDACSLEEEVEEEVTPPCTPIRPSKQKHSLDEPQITHYDTELDVKMSSPPPISRTTPSGKRKSSNTSTLHDDPDVEMKTPPSSMRKSQKRTSLFNNPDEEQCKEHSSTASQPNTVTISDNTKSGPLDPAHSKQQVTPSHSNSPPPTNKAPKVDTISITTPEKQFSKKLAVSPITKKVHLSDVRHEKNKSVSSADDSQSCNQVSSFKARLNRLKSSSKRVMSNDAMPMTSKPSDSSSTHLHEQHLPKQKSSNKVVRHIALRDIPLSPVQKKELPVATLRQKAGTDAVTEASHTQRNGTQNSENSLTNTQTGNIQKGNLRSTALEKNRKKGSKSSKSKNALSKYRIERDIPPFDPSKRKKMGKVQRLEQKLKASTDPSRMPLQQASTISTQSKSNQQSQQYQSSNIVSSFNRNPGQASSKEQAETKENLDLVRSQPQYTTSSAFSNIASGIVTFFKKDETNPAKEKSRKKPVIASLIQAEAAKQKQLAKEKQKAQRKEKMKKRLAKAKDGALVKKTLKSKKIHTETKVSGKKRKYQQAPGHQEACEPKRKRSKHEDAAEKVKGTKQGVQPSTSGRDDVSSDGSFVSAKSSSSAISTYQMSEGWKSDSDTEDEIERSKKHVPHWASSVYFQRSIEEQNKRKDKYDGEAIFGPCILYCSLREVFPNSASFRARSSGVWKHGR